MVKNERGSTLVLTMMVLLFLSILAVAIIGTSKREGLQAIRHEHKTQAHYNARSGVYMAGKWLEAGGLDEVNELEIDEYIELAGDKSDLNKGETEGEIAIRIVKKAENIVRIESTGLEKGQSETIVVDDINFNNLDKALYLNGNSTGNNDEIISILRSDLATIKGDIGANTNGANRKGKIVFDGKSYNVGYDAYKEIGGKVIDREGKERERVLYLPYRDNSGNPTAEGNSTIKQVVDGEKSGSGKTLKDDFNSSNLLNPIEYKEVDIPKILENLSKQDIQDIKDETYNDDIHIDVGSKSVNIIENTKFKGNVYIEAGDNVNKIKGSVFEKDVYIEAGGNVQLGDSMNTFKGNVYITARSGGIQLGSDKFEGDVYLSTGSQDISIQEKPIFEKNLFINGTGTVQFKEVNIGGLVYAPNRYLDFQEEVYIGYAVVANRVRFKEKVTIDFEYNEEILKSIPSDLILGAKADILETIIKSTWSKGE